MYMRSPNIVWSKVALTIVILTQGFFHMLFGSELPEPVRSLVAKRTIAISNINIIFIQELEKIKINYMKAGDLENANLIAGLINHTKQSDSDSSLSLDGLIPEVLQKEEMVGKWKIYDTAHPQAWSGVITITKDLYYRCIGEFGTPNDQDDQGKVVIKKENNAIIIGPYEFDTSNISSGKIFLSSKGDPRTMERIK